MVEFSLVAPIFYFVLIAAMNGGLLMYTVNAAAHSASVAMITLADEGTLASADTDAVAAAMGTGLGTSSFGSVQEIDVYAVDLCSQNQPAQQCSGQTDGAEIPAPSSSSRYDIYRRDGSCVRCPWPPAIRSDSASSLTAMGVNIRFRYTFLGMGGGTLDLTATRLFRLEPRNP